MRTNLPALTAAMAAAIFTGATSWLVFGQDKVARPEMVEYVEKHDRWTGPIRTNARNIERLEKVCDRMVAAQLQLLVEQRVLITKVDALVDE